MANISVLNCSLESIFHEVFATTYVFHIYQAKRPYLFPHLIPTF